MNQSENLSQNTKNKKNSLLVRHVVAHTPAVPVLEEWRQEDDKFKVSLGYIVSP